MLGMAYKANLDDMRESPALSLMEGLEKQGAMISYNDPYIPQIKPSRQYAQFLGRRLVEVSGEYDLILIVTAHKEYYQMDLMDYDIPVVDTRNVIKSPSKWLFKA